MRLLLSCLYVGTLLLAIAAATSNGSANKNSCSVRTANKTMTTSVTKISNISTTTNMTIKRKRDVIRNVPKTYDISSKKKRKEDASKEEEGGDRNFFIKVSVPGGSPWDLLVSIGITIISKIALWALGGCCFWNCCKKKKVNKLSCFAWSIKVILAHFYSIAFACLALSLNNNALWVSSSYIAAIDEHPTQPIIYAFKLSLYCTEHWAPTLEIRKANDLGVNTGASFYCEDPVVTKFLTDAHKPILSAGFSMAFMILAFFALITATLFSIWKKFRKNHLAMFLWVMFLLLVLLSIFTSGVAARMTKDLEMDFEKALRGQFEHSDGGHSSYFSSFPSTIKKNSDGTQNFEMTTASAYHCLIAHMSFAVLMLLLGLCVIVVDGCLQWAAERKEKREKKESGETVSLLSTSRMNGPSQITPLSSFSQLLVIEPTPVEVLISKADGETMKLLVKEFDVSSSKRVHIGNGSTCDSVRSSRRDISKSNSMMTEKEETDRSG